MAQPCGGHILSKIVKEPKGPIQKVSPGCFGDYFLKEISMYPLDTYWLNCLRNHNEITMYPLDKCTLSPSERTEEGLGHAVAGVERNVSDVDDRVDVVMRDITDVQDRASALEETVQELRLDLESLTTRHNNLWEDYAHLDHNFKILHCGLARLMEDRNARLGNQAGGVNNPINVDELVEETDDEEGSVDTDQSVSEEVEPEDVEVVQEVVYVGDNVPRLIPVGPLVEIEEGFEDMPPLEPQERDLPDEPAPPYVP